MNQYLFIYTSSPLFFYIEKKKENRLIKEKWKKNSIKERKKFLYRLHWGCYNEEFKELIKHIVRQGVFNWMRLLLLLGIRYACVL